MKHLQVLMMGLVLSFSVQARDLQDIKTDIFNMAESFKGQADTDGSKQAAIEELIDELLPLIPNYTMTEKAIRALGTWNQIWGPYAFDDSNTVPRGVDVNKIFQFISPNGFYYNFAEYKMVGIKAKTFLRGVYKIEEDRIRVQFDRTGLIREREVDYASAGMDIENGNLRVFNFPSNIPPVGVKGGLVEIYADDEIRLNYGVVGDDISKPALFVMKRIK